MARPATLEDVRAMPYFASLSDEEARRFAADIVARSCPAHDVVVIEGERALGFYFVRSGKARIFRTAPDGREQTFRIAAAGDTFGEVPIFDGAPNPATVEAMEPAEILLVPAESFVRLCHRHPAVAMDLLRHFAVMLRAFTGLVEQISLQTVQGRLARYLYQLAREEGVTGPRGIIVPRALTQQDLASLVGSVREVVSRTLRAMEDDGIVEISRKEILIRDLEALKALL